MNQTNQSSIQKFQERQLTQKQAKRVKGGNDGVGVEDLEIL